MRCRRCRSRSPEHTIANRKMSKWRGSAGGLMSTASRHNQKTTNQKHRTTFDATSYNVPSQSKTEESMLRHVYPSYKKSSRSEIRTIALSPNACLGNHWFPPEYSRERGYRTVVHRDLHTVQPNAFLRSLDFNVTKQQQQLFDCLPGKPLRRTPILLRVAAPIARRSA